MKSDGENDFPTVAFFHQERKDGGLRTGVQSNGHTLLHSFQEGFDERDPSLLWFVEIRCQADTAPFRTPEEARKWLATSSDWLQDALNSAAEELAGGLDTDFLPWEWTYPKSPPGWIVHVVVGAMRRLEALQVANKLRKLAKGWKSYVNKLKPLVAA